MAWKDLTLSDKARMINLAVRSGITDLRTIEEVYNKYALGGPEEKEQTDYTVVSSPWWNSPAQHSVQVPYRDVKVSDEELVDNYVENVLWKMENPRNKGYNKSDGKYYAYTDKDSKGNTHTNIGPGLEKNGHPHIDYTRGYTKQELDALAKGTVSSRVQKMTKSLQDMDNSKYAETRDTLSMGPLLSLVDIAYNVGTAKKRNLPEKWPTIVKHLAEGNLEKAKTQTYSGSTRRQKMRNDLLTYDAITSKTVKNR